MKKVFNFMSNLLKTLLTVSIVLVFLSGLFLVSWLFDQPDTLLNIIGLFTLVIDLFSIVYSITQVFYLIKNFFNKQKQNENEKSF